MNEHDDEFPTTGLTNDLEAPQVPVDTPGLPSLSAEPEPIPIAAPDVAPTLVEVTDATPITFADVTPPWPAEPIAPPVIGAGAADEPTSQHNPSAPPPPGPWWAGAPINPAASTAPLPPAAASATSKNAGSVTSRGILVGAVVGALVASLVTGGLFLAFRDDDGSSTTTVRTDSSLVSNNGTIPLTPIPNTASGGINVKAVLARVRPAVVAITVTTSRGQGGGTGFIVKSDGTIVTNAHVIDGATDVQVTLANGEQLAAKVKGSDDSHDLAVIDIEGSGYAVATYGDSDAMQPGDPVVAVGNALGLGISVTNGVISALDRQVEEPNGATILGALQTDAAINPGNSGGPLVNSQGQVIGVNTAIASPTQANNVGFAISISSARHIIDSLIEGKAPRDAFLGVSSEDVTPSLVRKESLKVDRGAFVTNVEDGSAASTAGIKAGDVVVAIDGKQINGTGELRRFIRRHSPGDRVPFTVVESSGKQRVVVVRLGEAPVLR